MRASVHPLCFVILTGCFLSLPYLPCPDGLHSQTESPSKPFLPEGALVRYLVVATSNYYKRFVEVLGSH